MEFVDDVALFLCQPREEMILAIIQGVRSDLEVNYRDGIDNLLFSLQQLNYLRKKEVGR